jgi:head-tail adaptor
MMIPDPLVINAGELIHAVQIQASPDGAGKRDSAGQPIDTWDVVLSTRAKIEGSDSRTFRSSFSNNTLASQSTDCITMRWPGSSVVIEPGQRVVCGDNVFLIQAVDNVLHRNRKLVLACIGIDEDSN